MSGDSGGSPRPSRALKLFRPWSVPAKVYRFLGEEIHADALARGDIWVTTLDDCRRKESARGGDAWDAMINQTRRPIFGHGDDPAVQEALRGLVSLPPYARNISISNNIYSTVHPNAWVFCSTLEYEPAWMAERFGKFCVVIKEPMCFFYQLTQAIRRAQKLSAFGLGPVVYQGPTYVGTAAPRHPGFVKRPDPYSREREFRMIWSPPTDVSARIRPTLFTGAVGADLLERIA